MSRYEVMLWHEREESSAAESVSGVSGLDVQVLHALAHFHVFRSAPVSP